MFVVYTAMVDDSARFLLIPGKLTSNLTNAVAMARTPSIASHTNISYVSYSLDPSAFDITIRRTTNGNQHEKGAGESVCKSWNEVFFSRVHCSDMSWRDWHIHTNSIIVLANNFLSTDKVPWKLVELCAYTMCDWAARRGELESRDSHICISPQIAECCRGDSTSEIKPDDWEIW